tara:strand:+ start:2808 stop:3326 length:519 start_codon:yes stop_codon:yes gene_type:complete
LADIKINNKDLAQLQKKIVKLRKLSERDLSTELGTTVAKSDARMKRTISGAGFKDSKGGLVQGQNYGRSGNQAFVENNTNYSPYIEFGIGKGVDLSEMRELGIPASYAAQFKGKGFTGTIPVNLGTRENPNWRQVTFPQDRAPKPFFFPAVRIELQALLTRITNRIKNIKNE